MGGGCWAVQRRAKGENWDNCNRITIKKLKSEVRQKKNRNINLNHHKILLYAN